MEYLNLFIICGIYLIGFIGIKEELEGLAVFAIVIASVLLLFHGVFYLGERGAYFDDIYEFEQYHRHSEHLTQEEKDSLNDVIHEYKYSNKHFWMERQYIPDEVDTLTFFN